MEIRKKNKKSYIGLYGLGVMGQNLALNIANHGFQISVFNKFDIEATTKQLADKSAEICGCETVEEFIKSLEAPRKIILMVTAGTVVDSVVGELLPMLEKGDMILDCGNSYFKDTMAREAKLLEKGIYFFGIGVSGGAKGALTGPSMMPGGNKAVYETYLQPVFEKIAAHTAQGEPCCSYIGENGAGHYVKMVHNGIEYGDIQIICEAYDLMKRVLMMSNEEMAAVFQCWNNGRLHSYLIEITVDILLKKDSISGIAVLDTVLDDAGQKGTGKWTSMESIELDVPSPTIVESVMARYISSRKDERVRNAGIFYKEYDQFTGDCEEFLVKLEKAVYASKIMSYTQGFYQLKQASQYYQWDLDLGKIALLWREGCIIQAQFLEKINEAYTRTPNMVTLMEANEFRKDIEDAQGAWREVISCGISHGRYMPCIMNSLQYFDGMTAEYLPANLLQALRDCFGSHTYHRIDDPKGKAYHTDWRKL